jgi:hypothetical protein
VRQTLCGEERGQLDDRLAVRSIVFSDLCSARKERRNAAKLTAIVSGG